mgnify:CR=1 FL=1
MEKLKVGIVGLGKMSSAIACRLSNCGFMVNGWNRSGISESKSKSLKIRVKKNIDLLAQSSEIIILSLTDDTAVKAVLHDLCKSNLHDKLIVDTSTVHCNTLLDSLALIKKSGANAIDAPISGWPSMVKNGTVGIYIGGHVKDFNHFLPVAEALSNRIEHNYDQHF